MPKRSVPILAAARPLEEVVVEAMQNKKAEQIVRMDLAKISGASWSTFLICHGQSTTQVGAIADEVCRLVQTECQQKPLHSEGYTNAEWILLDFGFVAVHVFLNEIREHYQLEHLWADAETTLIEEDEPVKNTKPVNERNRKPQSPKAVQPNAEKRTPRAPRTPRAATTKKNPKA